LIVEGFIAISSQVLFEKEINFSKDCYVGKRRSLVSQDSDPKILEFRLQRFKKAPRNWTFWVAGFTVANGVFLSLQHDIMILAGLVYPFSYPGSMPHYISALFIAAFAVASFKTPKILLVPLGVYVADMLYAAHLEIWSGFAMHVVVLVFICIIFIGIRSVKDLQARADESNY
jgi:hypothetical protein